MYHARKHSAKLSHYYYFQKCFYAQQASQNKVLIFIYFSINKKKDKINLCLDDYSPTGDCHRESKFYDEITKMISKFQLYTPIPNICLPLG